MWLEFLRYKFRDLSNKKWYFIDFILGVDLLIKLVCGWVWFSYYMYFKWNLDKLDIFFIVFKKFFLLVIGILKLLGYVEDCYSN